MGSRQPKNTFGVRDNEDLDIPQTSPPSLSWDLELSCEKQNKQTTTINLYSFRPRRAVSLDLRREEVFAHQPSVWSTKLQRCQLLWCGPQRPHHLTPVSFSSIISSASPSFPQSSHTDVLMSLNPLTTHSPDFYHLSHHPELKIPIHPSKPSSNVTIQADFLTSPGLPPH